MQHRKIRRINFLAGPGAGKSITATNVVSQLGFKGYNVALVDEVVKDWTYIDRSPLVCDSFYLQACQIQKEDIRLRGGVDIIVSDSPLILQYFYAFYHDVPLQEPMRIAALEFEKLYPSIHIFIERVDSFYSEVGRYEKLEESKKIDGLIKDTLEYNEIQFKSISCLNQEEIVNYIISEINNGRHTNME